MHFMRKNLAFATAFSALVMIAGCSDKKNVPEVKMGSAKVALTAAGLAAVDHVTLSITGGATPITQTLTKVDNTHYSASISSVPVGTYTFTANAYADAAGANLVLAGHADGVVITASAVPAIVSIVMHELTAPVGPTAKLPVIDGLAASAASVTNGAAASVSVTAHSPDSHALAYQWSDLCTGNLHGTFADSAIPATTWTAPASAAVCQLSVRVGDATNMTSVTAYLVLTVTGPATGSANVNASVDTYPILTVSAADAYIVVSDPPAGLTVGITADVVATSSDADGSPVTLAWTSSCTGTFSPSSSAPSVRFHSDDPNAQCTLTVVASDSSTPANTIAGVVVLSGAVNLCANVTCTPQDSCHDVGTCNPATGFCSNPAKVCTAQDLCHVVGACDLATGSCSNPEKCAAGQTCELTTGVCSTPDLCAGVTCVALDVCHDVGTCTAGVCSNPAKTCPAGEACSLTDGLCHATDLCAGVICPPATNLCQVAGTCTAGVCSAETAKTCPVGETCDVADGVCKLPVVPATVVVPQLAKKLEINWKGLAMGTDGAVYQTGNVLLPAKTFDGITITSAGSTDVFAAKYDAAGAIQWAVRYGNSSSQDASSGAAVTADGTLALGGKFSGTLDPDPISAPSQVDFLEFLNPDGTHKFSAAYNNGLNGRFAAIAANPSLNLVAVCGLAAAIPTDFVGATAITPLPAAQPQDIIVGVFDSAGTKLWARQIGSADSELCDSITIDDNGDVYAAGKYNGVALNLGLGNLPNPGGLSRRHLWVAKFNGTTGATISNAAFGSGAGIHAAKSLAVDATGRLFIAGAMSNNLPFGSIVLSVTDGSNDAFVAKVNPAAGYAADWALRAGGVGDDEVRGVAVDSFGNPVVVGLYNEVSTGFLTLTAASGTSDAFLVKLDGTTGATVAATGGQASYGDDLGTQNANAIAINRLGVGSVLNNVVFGGSFGSTIDFGAPNPASTPDLTTNGTDTFLVFGKLQ
jgi:hypothetical protein